MSELSARIRPGIPSSRKRRRRPMRFLVIGHGPKLDKWFLASLVPQKHETYSPSFPFTNKQSVELMRVQPLWTGLLVS